MDDEISYLDYEKDNNFLNWYNIKCVQTISELSRQVRTLLNYRATFIYQSFRPKSLSYPNSTNKKFQESKIKFESLALNFLKLLNNLKDRGIIVYQSHNLLEFRNQMNSSFLNRLSNLTHQIFNLIHYFSEENDLLTNSFFKMIVKIAQEVCKVRIYLKFHQIEFYKELIENYRSMEMALTTSNQNTTQKKCEKTEKSEMIKL